MARRLQVLPPVWPHPPLTSQEFSHETSALLDLSASANSDLISAEWRKAREAPATGNTASQNDVAICANV